MGQKDTARKFPLTPWLKSHLRLFQTAEGGPLAEAEGDPLASDPLVSEIERDFSTHISYDFEGALPHEQPSLTKSPVCDFLYCEHVFKKICQGNVFIKKSPPLVGGVWGGG